LLAGANIGPDAASWRTCLARRPGEDRTDAGEDGMSESRRTVSTLALWLVAAACLLMPGAARAVDSAYIANSGDNTISQYDIDPQSGALRRKAPPTVSAGSSPVSVAVTPDGKNAYVADFGDNDVAQYSIDPLSGGLFPKTPATVAAGQFGGFSTGIAVTPDGKSVYVTNGGDNTVSQYDIDPQNGALTPKTTATVAAGAGPTGVAVSPDGGSAYVSNAAGFLADGTIAQYDIDPRNGALTPKTPAFANADLGPSAAALTPNGRSAYVANQFGFGGVSGNNISQYDVDPAGGQLSPKTPATVFAAPRPVAIAVAPDGGSAYTAGLGFGDVSQYDIDPGTGTLSPKAPATVAAGDSPLGVIVTPDGRSVYVTNRSAGQASGSIFQYDVTPASGTLSPKMPATVSAGVGPVGIAVGGLPRPATREQCTRGGWRRFPQFRNQGQCIAFVKRRR
jgi:YVTN family beta-propeller protein